MKKLLTILLPVMLSACAAPKDDTYCAGFGVTPASAEYANCKAYFARMDGWFNADHSACTQKAAQSIPDYLYDNPRYGEAQSVDRFGTIRTSSILIEPDYRKNMALDREREKIIAPCMLQKGWNSSTDWKAGRRGESAAPEFSH